MGIAYHKCALRNIHVKKPVEYFYLVKHSTDLLTWMTMLLIPLISVHPNLSSYHDAFAQRWSELTVARASPVSLCFSMYMDSYHINTSVVRPYHPYNENSSTGKVFLYCHGPGKLLSINWLNGKCHAMYHSIWWKDLNSSDRILGSASI